ncbi:hypothetical protein MNBD_UNCLBAC01-1764 [hydrothermal vent metagenome]|uniref:beta-galactosidase n=1 Tax=hydrothermal vent metagenome TaxID=652676 RepID=A0A3B1DEN8_9ZZZZ
MKNYKIILVFSFLFSFFFVPPSFIYSFEKITSNKEVISNEEKISTEKIDSKELVRQAWEASSKSDVKRLDKIIQQALEFYGKEANDQQNLLTDFPKRGEEAAYQELNDVTTCLFIQAEALMNTGRTEESVKAFQHIIKEYSWGQAWDPRGWYWSVAEKSQASIDIITGNVPEEEEEGSKSIRTRPVLHTPAKDQIVDYTKYGKFLNVGKNNFHYSIADRKGLSAAVGEGIYPNIRDVYKNPKYREAKKSGRLEGSHWDYVTTDDLETAYFKWFKASEPWGVRLFYIGMTFEKSGMLYDALRAYHSLVVHFPKTVAWTYWQTPWYPAQAAIAKIKYIIRSHPELNLEYADMRITVQNGSDNDAKNDTFYVSPGRIFKNGHKEEKKFDKATILGKVKKRVGSGKVRLVQYENRHWELLVNDKPYVIKGITYEPTKIGQSPDKGTLENWMEEDTNGNGLPDGPYDAWVDANRNDKQDEDEPVVGDFQLMKEMGVNTIRIYHVPSTPNKKVLRKLYKDYGIRVIMGDFFGKYAIGSGASWSEGTDYENLEHQKNMLESVKKMVMEHKDEPYILMWLLGNENNYGVACNADTKPEAYFKFANKVAKWIKSVDTNHPVAVNNGDALFLNVFAGVSPDIDIFSANVYRGDYGFGSFWEQVADASDKPAFITEYGCPAYAKHLTLEEAEEAQAAYHKGNWLDIAGNMAGNPRGVGNSLGGVAFEWLDEWWKNYEPYRHDKKSDAIGPFPGGYYYEEWFGLIGQGKGKHSPFMRQLRKSYFIYKELWAEDLKN